MTTSLPSDMPSEDAMPAPAGERAEGEASGGRRASALIFTGGRHIAAVGLFGRCRTVRRIFGSFGERAVRRGRVSVGHSHFGGISAAFGIAVGSLRCAAVFPDGGVRSPLSGKLSPSVPFGGVGARPPGNEP